MPQSAFTSGSRPKDLVVNFAIPRSRSYSADSSSSWGSDVATVGCGSKYPNYEDKKAFYHSEESYYQDYEEFQVEEWLLYSNEPDFATRPPPPYTPSIPHYCNPHECKLPHPDPAYIFHNSPATYLLHWIFAFLIQWNILQSPLPRPPVQSRPIYAVPPPKKKKVVEYNPYFCLPYRNPAYRVPERSEAYFYLSDSEYIVPPTPGTNEDVLRIPFTNDFSRENVETHTFDMLRIYRVPGNKIHPFSSAVSGQRLCGRAVRKPRDTFDTISVVRQSHVSWDMGAKDDVWILVGRDLSLINSILRRCDPRRPPFKTRIKQLFLKFAYRIIAPVAPTWLL